MVFARSKLVLEDNCYEEDPGSVEMKLIGPNVPKMYNVAFELIKAVFNVTDSDIQETTYSWGKSAKGEKFKVTWWLHKDMDLFSYLYTSFKLSGQGDAQGGSLTLSMKGILRSEYPQDTVWQRSLFYEMMRTFWHRAFYHKKREEYAEECRHAMVLYQKKLAEYFNRLRGADAPPEPAAAEE
ncbi:MAG: hypothetical protein HY520_01765 [Candidatus Aenigmarchaeota archaeon]|nr:hypothetical protein [Candidatus Aenigmarchaeota archaeon]